MRSLRDKNVRLLIIGTGLQEGFLKPICLKKQLGNKILFLGYLDESEKLHILGMCDIYVSTSQHEGLVEFSWKRCSVCGLPIVGYGRGGHTDFLKNQEKGYVVTLNDIDFFTKGCALLIRNTELRKAIDENKKHRVEEFYVNRCARMCENAFISTLSIKNNNQTSRTALGCGR